MAPTAAETVVYIGLGSNLQQPLAQLQHALTALATDGRLTGLRSSAVYRSAALATADSQPRQPDYLNAVIEARTRLAPLALLDVLQAQEQAQGRQRLTHWGPRTIDLDLLLYGARKIDHPRLTVPHAGLHERSFVLTPLAALAPQLEIPGLGRVADLACACSTPELHLTHYDLQVASQESNDVSERCPQTG